MTLFHVNLCLAQNVYTPHVGSIAFQVFG